MGCVLTALLMKPTVKFNEKYYSGKQKIFHERRVSIGRFCFRDLAKLNRKGFVSALDNCGNRSLFHLAFLS
jgi:hypothetical protein